MGVPLLRGRLVDEGIPSDSENKIVVNETMARRSWPGEDPIGKRVRISWTDNREDEVIGVVGDVRHQTLESESRPMIYWPYARNPYVSMTMAVRTDTRPESAVGSMVRAIREEDPALAVAEIRSMGQVVADSVAQQRLTMFLLAVFACVALLLAAIGIYGVTAYHVTERTREIGIRMALGAGRAQVLRTIVGQAALLAAAGIAAGTAGALSLTRFLRGLLFEIEPTDPLTFAVIAAGLGATALLASYIPGRRATLVDPTIALRAE